MKVQSTEITNYKSFGERLKVLMGGVSSRVFEQKTGVGEASIRKYLKGQAEPTLGNLVKIANACSVRVGWLAAGELPKELKREVLDESLDLIDAVGRIMEEKGLDQLQAFEEYKANWDTSARKILKLPVREKVASLAAAPATHPALVMLENWLAHLYKTDQVKWAEILGELRAALPEFNEWLEKKRPGENSQAGVPQANYNNS